MKRHAVPVKISGLWK